MAARAIKAKKGLSHLEEEGFAGDLTETFVGDFGEAFGDAFVFLED